MEEDTCSNALEQNTRLAGGGGGRGEKSKLGSSSIAMAFITTPFVDMVIPIFGANTHLQEGQHGVRYMISQVEKKEKHKKGREDDSTLESSSKWRRTTFATEEKRRRDQEEVVEESHNKNEPAHMFDQASGESGNTAKAVKHTAKDRLDASEQQLCETNFDTGVSFAKNGSGDISTVHSDAASIDIWRGSEAPVPSSVFHKDRDDGDVNKEKVSRYPLFDYATSLQMRLHTTWGIYEPLNFFTAADWLKCITNVHPIDERSELEKEIGMFSRDWVSRHPEDRNYLDGSGCDRDMERIFESPFYSELQNLVKSFDRQTVLKIKQFISLVPKTEEVYSYQINWAVVDEHELHNKIRPWIANNVKNTTEEEAEYIVHSLQMSMKDHVSASTMLQRILAYNKLVNKSEAECLILKMWTMLIFKIKNVEEGGCKHSPSVAPKEEWSELGQGINTQATDLLTRLDQDSSDTGIGNCASNVNIDKICDSDRLDSHLELLNLSETSNVEKPLEVNIFKNMIAKNIEELLSVEINWAVYDEHELHKTMRAWMKKEILKLLKKQKALVVDYVVKVIKEHEGPLRMLELLQPFVEDDTEMVVQILWRTLVILVKILETGFHRPISTATPNREMLDGSRQTSVWTGVESKNRVGCVYERNKRHNSAYFRLIKAYKFEVLCELVRVRDAIPRGIKELLNYDIDWAVSDKINLDNTLRPWVSSEVTEFVRSQKDAATLVESIVSIIKDHGSASQLLKLVKPTLGIDRSQRFLRGLWRNLIFGIKSAGEVTLSEYDVPTPYPQLDEETFNTERGISKQFGDRYSRNRQYLLMAFDYENLCELKRVNETMPKTKEELFSCKINWDVYNKHELHANMRQGIWIETLEFMRQKEEAGLVEDEIIWSIFDYHASASQREFIAQGKANMVVDQIMQSLSKDRMSASEMTELLQPIFGHGSEKFVMRMWHSLICGIKLLEAGVKQRGIKKRWPVLLIR